MQNTYTYSGSSVNVTMRVTSPSSAEDASFMLAHAKYFAFAEIFIDGSSSAHVLISPGSGADLERVIETLGTLPRVIENERWSTKDDA